MELINTKLINLTISLRRVGARAFFTLATSLMLFSSYYATCAAQNRTEGVRKLTLTETGSLESCAKNADVAWRIAMSKRAGLPKESARQRAASEPGFLPIIDSVYADSFDRPWPYAIQYYEHCARQRVSATEEMVRMTDYCLQVEFVADAAAEGRQAGLSRDKVYGEFQKFMSDQMMRQDVDVVYAEKAVDGQEMHRAWWGCMSLLTESPPSTLVQK